MPSQPFISFAGVSKSYDGTHSVVAGLDLEVARGEFVSLLGPSGSGKTTTLMMLAGFESTTRGEIRLAGKRLDDKPPHQRDIGMVFQNYALFPQMTIAENVAFPLSVRKVNRREQKVRVLRALDMVELTHLAERRPAQLSGGQQQRVALARALVFEPSVVLMDEPLGALDKRLRETMQYEIMRLHRELSLTIVYVTHDQNEALTMSDRVAVFFNGRVQQAATPAELYENAANAFVANFVGENNGLTGRALQDDIQWATMQLSDGTLVFGRPGAGLIPGSAAMLALRPERAHIAATPSAIFEATKRNMNILQGIVTELIYCGDHHRVRVKLSHGESAVVKVPNTQHQDLPALGHPTAVTWCRNDCKVLPAADASPTAPLSNSALDAPSSSSSSRSPLIAGVN